MRSRLKTGRIYIYIYLRMVHLVDLGYSFQKSPYIYIHSSSSALHPILCVYACVIRMFRSMCISRDTCAYMCGSEADCFPEEKISHWTWSSPICEANRLLNSGHWSLSPPRGGQVSSTHLDSYVYLGSKLMLEQHTHCPVSISLQPGRTLSILLNLLNSTPTSKP